MSKRLKKYAAYPIVHIQGLDHSASHGGEYEAASPIPMDAVGFLYKETKEAYYVVPMVFGYDLSDGQNVSIAIVKHPGIKIRKLK